MNATSNSTILRDTWDAEIGLDPTEETKIADWVEQPVGAQKFGNSLYLRKLPSIAASTYASTSTTAGLRASLTIQAPTDSRVQASAVSKYGACSIDRATLNRAIDDGNVRSGLRKQLMAGVKEAVDVSLFTLAASLSVTESGAAIDDAMVRSALGQLATNAKGKFNEGAAKLLVVHPTQLKNVWNIPAIKEYQIRGTIGAAINAQMNAYGLVWRESGNVYSNGTVRFNPLLLKDAWALAWNEKPHLLDVQTDGLTEVFIAYAEYGVCEWFDSSGVSLNIS
jgi:hypothetical protein